MPVLLWLACVTRPVAAPADPAAPCASMWAGPAEGELLCDEHLMANSAEIHWRSWALAADQYALRPAIQERAGLCGYGVVTKPPLFSVVDGGRRLSLHDAGDTSIPSCEHRPGRGHRTVMMISEKLDR